MKRHLSHHRSCSCTNCAYKSWSKRPSVKQLLDEGTRVDKLFYGKYLPLRERKLLEKLVRTRDVYDDVRNELLTSSESDRAKSEYSIRSQHGDDTARSSAILKIIDLIDRGQIRSPNTSKLSTCCNCCSCSSLKKIRKNNERHHHAHKHNIPSENIAKYRERAEKRARRRRKLSEISAKARFKTKKTRSEPFRCECRLSSTGIVKKTSKASTKRPKLKEKASMTDKLPPLKTALETKPKKRLSVNKVKDVARCFCTKNISVLNTSSRFRIKKDSLSLFRDKLKKSRVTEGEQCFLEICDPDECDPHTCYKKNKYKRTAAKVKHTTESEQCSLDVCDPDECNPHTCYKRKKQKRILAKQKNRDQSRSISSEISISKVRFKNSKIHNKSTRQNVKKKKSLNQNIQYDNHVCMCEDKKSGRKEKKDQGVGASKKHKKDISSKTESSSSQTGLTKLARCFCTSKLKKMQKKHKKPMSRTTMASLSTQHSDKRNRITQTQTKPIRTAYSRLKKAPSYLLPYECEPYICTPGKCNPYECLERIKARDRRTIHTSTLSNTKQYTSSSTSQEMKKREGSTQRSNERKRMRTQGISVHKPAVRNSKTQIGKGVKPKHVILNKVPFLERCMCSLKLKNKRKNSPEMKTAPMTSEIRNNSKVREKDHRHYDQMENISPKHSNRQAVRIGSSFSFDIEFYKDKSQINMDNKIKYNRSIKTVNYMQNHIQPKPVVKYAMGNAHRDEQNTSQQINPITKNKVIAAGTRDKEKSFYVGSAVKACYCTLKLEKKGKHTTDKNKHLTSKNTETPVKLFGPRKTSAYKSTSTNASYINDLKKDNFPSQVCLPDLRNPYECFKERRKRIMKRYHIRHSIPDKNNKKSITSIASSNFNGSLKSAGTQSIISKHKEQKSNAKRKQEDLIQPNIFDSSRQSVRLGSNFSFNINLYKDCLNKKTKQKEPNTTSDMPNINKTRLKESKHEEMLLKYPYLQANDIEYKASNNGHRLKRSVCAIKLQNINNAGKPVIAHFMHIIQNNPLNNPNNEFSKINQPNCGTEDGFMKSVSELKLLDSCENHWQYESKVEGIHQTQGNSLHKNSQCTSNLSFNIDLQKSGSNTKSVISISSQYSKYQYGYNTANNNQLYFNDNPFYRSYYALNVKVSNLPKLKESSNQASQPFNAPKGITRIGSKVNFKFSASANKHTKYPDEDQTNKKQKGKSILKKDDAKNKEQGKIGDKPNSKLQIRTNRAERVRSKREQSSMEPFNQSSFSIGSNVSFDIKLFKEKMPDSPTPSSVRNVAHATNTDMKERKGPKEMNTLHTDTPKVISDTSKTGKVMKDKMSNASLAKRCFCTLKLKNKDNTKIETAATKEKDKSTMVKNKFGNPIVSKDQEVMTKKLEPYECTPGVCVPDKCDPIKCLKLIQQRLKNDQHISAPNDIDSKADKKYKNIGIRTDRAARVSRSKHKPEMPIEMQQAILKLPERKAISVGSKFSFNIEFYKENKKTDPPTSKEDNKKPGFFSKHLGEHTTKPQTSKEDDKKPGLFSKHLADNTTQPPTNKEDKKKPGLVSKHLGENTKDPATSKDDSKKPDMGLKDSKKSSIFKNMLTMRKGSKEHAGVDQTKEKNIKNEKDIKKQNDHGDGPGNKYTNTDMVETRTTCNCTDAKIVEKNTCDCRYPKKKIKLRKNVCKCHEDTAKCYPKKKSCCPGCPKVDCRAKKKEILSKCTCDLNKPCNLNRRDEKRDILSLAGRRFRSKSTKVNYDALSVQSSIISKTRGTSTKGKRLPKSVLDCYPNTCPKDPRECERQVCFSIPDEPNKKTDALEPTTTSTKKENLFPAMNLVPFQIPDLKKMVNAREMFNPTDPVPSKHLANEPTASSIRRCFCKLSLMKDKKALGAKPSNLGMQSIKNSEKLRNVPASGEALGRVRKADNVADNKASADNLDTIMPPKKQFKETDSLTNVNENLDVKPSKMSRFKKLYKSKENQFMQSRPKKVKLDDNNETNAELDEDTREEIAALQAKDKKLPKSLKDPLFNMVLEPNAKEVKNTDDIYQKIGKGQGETNVMHQGRLAVETGKVSPPVIDLIINRDTKNIINCADLLEAFDPSKRNKRICRGLAPIKPVQKKKDVHPKGCRCCNCLHTGIKPAPKVKPPPPRPKKRKKIITRANTAKAFLKFKSVLDKNYSFVKKTLEERGQCTCGSKICSEERQKAKMFKKMERHLIKKPLECTCDSAECHEAWLKTPQMKAQKRKEKDEPVRKKKDQKKIYKQKVRQLKEKEKNRQNRHVQYALDDALRRKKRKIKEKIALEQVERYRNASTGAMLAESLFDVVKLGASAVGSIARFGYRSVLHPSDVAHCCKEIKRDPRHYASTVLENIKDSGVSETAKRIKRRLGAMKSTRQFVAAVETSPLGNFLIHARDEDPSRRLRGGKQITPKDDFECSLFMGSLRKRPCLWVYYMCPWFYPHCVSLLGIWRQFVDVLLFILAVGVWSPCILAVEVCRALLCCFMCSG